MKNKQSESEQQTQSNSRLHALDVSILFASSFFWAWYQLAILGSAFFNPFDNFSHFDLYRLCAMVSTLASLFFWYKKEQLALQLLNSRRWEIIFVSLAVLGGIITMISVFFNHVIVIALGGIIVGSMAGYFMLAWSRMYSRRGSRSTAASITGAFAISFILAILVNSMEPIAGAITTAVLPFLVVSVLVGIQALFYSTKNPDTDVTNALQENSDVAFGAADVMVKSRDKTEHLTAAAKARKQEEPQPTKIPIALTIALIIFGFAFGFDIHDAPQNPTLFLISASGAVTGLVLFLVAFFKSSWLYGVYLVGILAGIAGYILVPALGLGAYEKSCFEMLLTVGSVSFFATSWTLLSDMTTITKKGSITVFVRGLLRCYIGIALGFAFGIFAQLSAGFTPLSEAALLSILGFGFVVGLLLFFVGSQSTWNNLRSNLSSDSKAQLVDAGQGQTSAVKEQVEELATIYRLTERESEILELLAKGRSRTRIAKALYVSENTVNTHVQHIYRKMDVNNIQELLDFVL